MRFILDNFFEISFTDCDIKSSIIRGPHYLLELFLVLPSHAFVSCHLFYSSCHYLLELFLVLPSHAFVSCHLFPHHVLLDMFSLLLCHYRRRPDRRKVVSHGLLLPGRATRGCLE